MKELTENDYSDFKNYANSIGLTPEEYALSLHETNQSIKSVLLENGSEFKSFVSEFHEMLDGLEHYKESDAKRGSYEHYELIKHVSDILSITSRNPKLLAQLYQHFPEGINGEIEKTN